MNDQELTSTVRQSVDGARMTVPEEQIVSRGHAIRASRRRRVAAGVTATATAGAAAIAAAIVLPGSPAPAAQDTAYVVSHVTQALNAVPAGTIFHLHSTRGLHPVVTDIWGRGPAVRTEIVTAGRLVSETGTVGTTTITSVDVNYQDRTWSRSVKRIGTLPAARTARNAASLACDNPNGFGIPDNASRMAALLRAAVSCGMLKVNGTAPVAGVTDVRLTMLRNGFTTTWYVSPTTYLPTRMTISHSGSLRLQNDFQWLPPTAANVAKLSLPAAPRGFTQVPMPTLP